MMGLLGATLGLPGAEVSPLGNANCLVQEKENHHYPVQISGLQRNNAKTANFVLFSALFS